MEDEIIRLKQHVEKLKRECLEKYTEIAALREQNEKLQNAKVQTKNIKHDQMDIIFEHEGPSMSTSSAPNSFRKPSRLGQMLVFKGTEHQVKLDAMKKLFEGNFEYKESPHSLVSISRWEFVIVCPNPDNCSLRTGIHREEGLKYFRKSFRPEFSKRLKQLRENQLVESKAFTALFDGINSANRHEKMLKSGGRFYTEGNVTTDYCTPPRDYLTLMRNVLLVKLGMHLGLHTKQVLSSNGKYIYILVCADEQDLQNEAESINYNLEMEIGEIDLASLEPVDDNLRPLRIVQHNNEKVKNVLADINKEFAETIELFKISENEENNYEPKGITDEVMETYHIYLLCMLHGLRTLTKSHLQGRPINVFLQKLLQNSIFKANRGRKKEHHIMNLWTKLGFKKPISPYMDYFRKIDAETNQCRYKHMWKKYETPNYQKKSIFSSIDRLKLLLSLIKRQVNIDYLAQKEIITAFFPLKTEFDFTGQRMFTGVLEDLTYEDKTKIIVKEAVGDDFYRPTEKGVTKNWPTSLNLWILPATKIRNYFGEKIAFYFAFTAYFGQIVSIPSLIGFGVFVVQRIYDPTTTVVVIVNLLYCMYASVWATVFIEYWKRKENCLSIKWGQTDYKQDEIPRPQFIGVAKRSPVDDEMDDIFYDPAWRYKFYAFSFFVTAMFVGIVIVIVLFLIILRTQITNTLIFGGVDWAGPIVSSINAVQIQVLNFFFNKIAVKLTNLENHRTQTDYENSLIVKSYVFQFINSFFSLFYIAFFKTNVEGCMVWKDGHKMAVKGANCVDDLYIQFITIFTISFLRNGLELGKPFLQAMQKSQEFKKVRHAASLIPTDIMKLRDQIDVQFSLPAYLTREVDGTLGDYLEISILFGYITLFAVAFPLSGVLAFLSIVVEVQVDRFKLLHLVRRPVPMGAKDISTWKTIFVFNSVASIVTNAALICFALPTFDNFPLARDNEYLIFSIFCLILLCIRAAVSFVIPDIPEKYDIISRRHAKIAQRFVKGWEVSGAKGETVSVYVNPDINGTIKATDDS